MAKTINQVKVKELEALKEQWAEAKKELEALTTKLVEKEKELKDKRAELVADGYNPVDANRRTTDLFSEVKELREQVKLLKSKVNSYKDKYKTLEKWSDSVRFYLTFKNLYDNKISYWKLKKLLGLDGTTIYRDILYAYIDAIVAKNGGDFKKAVQEDIYLNWNIETFKSCHNKVQQAIEKIKDEYYAKLKDTSSDDDRTKLSKEYEEKMKEVLKAEVADCIK